MRTQIATMFHSLPTIVLSILTSGCATPALWKQTAAREWKPNPPDQVILITDTNQQRDVVVVFRQFATRGSSGESRAVGWRISQSPHEVILAREAICQLTNFPGRPVTLPLFFAAQELPSNTSLAGYALWHPMEQQLTLHAPGVPTGPFTLPTSRQERQTALRVCVLPVAVAADTALVAAVLFVGAGAGYH